MKQIFKNLFKSLSLILVVAITMISFTACKNDDSKQAAVSPTTESISDTKDETENDIVADEVTDEDETNKEESTKPETENTEKPEEDKIESEEQTSTYPVTPGLYNHNKETLTFSDIYFEITEAELLSYFKTRDLNGVYGVVKQLGFDEFVKSITTHTADEVSYSKIVSLHKNESDGSLLGLSNLYTKTKNSYIDLYINYVYNIEDGKIIETEGQPEIIIENGIVSILYPFTYTDSETNEVVCTPLYVKSTLTLFEAVDIMAEDPLSENYHYLDSSASIESTTGLLDVVEANKKLAEMLGVEEDKILDEISNFELYFTPEDKLYILNTEYNFIVTEKTAESTYLLYDSCNITVVNEAYDLTLGLKILNIEIQIDETSKFVCMFYNELI